MDYFSISIVKKKETNKNRQKETNQNARKKIIRNFSLKKESVDSALYTRS